jgi:O-succinylbenzoate synthase
MSTRYRGRVRRVVVSIPMRTRFRGITVREAMLVEGAAGWGEFAPFLDYSGAELTPWWQAALEAAEVGFPAPLRDRIPVNVTVPAVSPEVAARVVVESGGCRTAKVKVAEPGQTEADDLARVETVRDALGPSGSIRIDANGAWDVPTAADRIPRYAKAAGGLEYVEQPCPTVEDLARVRRRVDVPIAADESVRRADDPLLVARREAADVVVLKVAPLGGVRAWLDLAERIGLPVVMSSFVDTAVRIAAGLALAACCPNCGTRGLRPDPALRRRGRRPQRPVDGSLAVGAVVPDDERLRALAAAPERTDWWLSRA